MKSVFSRLPTRSNTWTDSSPRSDTSVKMNRFRRWLIRNLDVLAFGAALLSVGPLMAWWSILVRRNIVTSDKLLRGQIEATFDGAQATQRLAALDVQTT